MFGCCPLTPQVVEGQAKKAKVHDKDIDVYQLQAHEVLRRYQLAGAIAGLFSSPDSHQDEQIVSGLAGQVRDCPTVLTSWSAYYSTIPNKLNVARHVSRNNRACRPVTLPPCSASDQSVHQCQNLLRQHRCRMRDLTAALLSWAVFRLALCGSCGS